MARFKPGTSQYKFTVLWLQWFDVMCLKWNLHFFVNQINGYNLNNVSHESGRTFKDKKVVYKKQKLWTLNKHLEQKYYRTVQSKKNYEGLSTYNLVKHANSVLLADFE